MLKVDIQIDSIEKLQKHIELLQSLTKLRGDNKFLDFLIPKFMKCLNETIEERLKPIEEAEEKKAIADADEILEFITAVIRGEVKDQLGFETSVKDRLTASKMLADRYKLFDKPKEPVDEKEEEEKNKSKVIIEVVDNSDLEKVLYENK